MLDVSQHKSFPYCHVVFPNPNQSIVHYQLLYLLLGVAHCAECVTTSSVHINTSALNHSHIWKEAILIPYVFYIVYIIFICTIPPYICRSLSYCMFGLHCYEDHVPHSEYVYHNNCTQTVIVSIQSFCYI